MEPFGHQTDSRFDVDRRNITAGGAYSAVLCLLKSVRSFGFRGWPQTKLCIPTMSKGIASLLTTHNSTHGYPFSRSRASRKQSFWYPNHNCEYIQSTCYLHF